MTDNTLIQARKHFIHGMSRIRNFWGFSKAMGAIFGAIYLSPDAMTLDQLVEQVGFSKGAVSTNIRQLERLNDKQKNNMLQILVKRIIINNEGEIISHELNSPFSYLSTLVDAFSRQNEEGFRSEHVTSGVQAQVERTAP